MSDYPLLLKALPGSEEEMLSEWILSAVTLFTIIADIKTKSFFIVTFNILQALAHVNCNLVYSSRLRNFIIFKFFNLIQTFKFKNQRLIRLFFNLISFNSILR